MLRALIAKDLRRAWRNPIPWLLNLALPLCLTGILGLVFGGHGDDNKLGRIRFAIVDEDKSVLSQFLRGAAGQEKMAEHFDPVFLDRDPALQQLNDEKLSAILIIPPHFTSNYLTGRAVALELIKNPAEQIYPAVLEELLGVGVTALNALSHNFFGEFANWRSLTQGDIDYQDVAAEINASGKKFDTLRRYIDPPLVGIKEKKAETSAPSVAGPAQPKFNLFAYLLAGMTALFLLLLASQGMADLHREVLHRTFERYTTMREHLLPFIAGKALFTVVILSMGAAILLGGGGLIFRIDWPRPLELAILTLAYACFATGLMAVLVALAPNERYAAALNNIVSMVFAIAGGCMFPPDQLPAAMRNYLSPLLPTQWYVAVARELWWSEASWIAASLKLMGSAIFCLALAAFLFRRRFKEGARA